MTEIVAARANRQELMAQVIERDGLDCAHPSCGQPVDLSATGRMQPTIDHWISQSKAYAAGWTYIEVWDLSNLRLMHRKCNAAKGDLTPNEDGTLPAKHAKTFRYRRDKRAERPEVCTSCNAGRNLSEDEMCNACGSGPQPERFPKWRQMAVKECDHDLFFCVACTVWSPEIRRSALDALLTGGEGYEDSD